MGLRWSSRQFWSTEILRLTLKSENRGLISRVLLELL